jgi:O-antigen/teichoic acid export membrane protein
LLLVPLSIRRATLPILSRLAGEGDVRRFRRLLLAGLGLSASAAMLLAVPVMIFSPYVMSLYGPAFRQDWDVLVILALTACVQAGNDVMSQVSISLERMWLSLCCRVSWVATLVGATALTAPRWGARGFAAAMLLAYCVQTVGYTLVAWVAVRRHAAAAPQPPSAGA